MKTTKLMTLGLAVICSFVFATSVMAQDAAKKDAAPAKPAAVKAEVKAEKAPAKKAVAKEVKAVKPVAKKQQFTGVVTAVDAQANTFTVEKKGKKAESMTFTAGKDVKVADIAKDSKVEVSYKKDGDKIEAVKVTAKAVVAKETKKEIKAEKAEKKAVKAEKKAKKAEQK